MKLLQRQPKVASEGTVARARPRLGGSVRSSEPGAPSHGEATDAGEALAPEAEQAQATWTTGNALLTKSLSFLLMGAVVCGPAALAMTLMGDKTTSTAAVKAEVTHDSVARRSVASEQAAAWVQAWLTTPAGRESELKTWWPGPVLLPKTAREATDVRVVDAVPTAPGVWAVTVAATVSTPKGKASRGFYQVPVQVDGGLGDASAAVKAVPAVVQAPSTAKNPPSPYTATLPSSSPVEASVQAFMNAYVAGDGDVSRYTTPGSSLRPVSDLAPFESVEVQSIRVTERSENVGSGQTPGEGQVLHALVEAAVTQPGSGTAASRQRSASWPLTITARDGRWEITDVDGTFQTTAETTSAGSTTSPKE